MQLVSLIAAITAAALSTVSASPINNVVADHKINGVQYASHVKFANEGALQRRGGGTTPAANKTLVYFGGPILRNVEITPLWWGSAVQSSDKLPAFYNGVANSSFYDMCTGRMSTPTQKLGRGKGFAPLTLSGFPTKKSLDNDVDIAPYLYSLVSSGTPIHFASGISISLQNHTSCSYFCAYHNTLNITNLNIPNTPYLYFGIVPDPGGACANGCGSNSDKFKNLCAVASHELAEATTDPAIGAVTGNNMAYPGGWYDEKDGNKGGEVGDICAGKQGTVTGGEGVQYTIQLEWSNKNQKCI
ncbi:hypothetical protein HDU76_009407 [Blyttiomyces sp. JEL0837]|nr:hypothetical protein HDU76_009407 [Blyttiomyces sp. JEL0837]